MLRGRGPSSSRGSQTDRGERDVKDIEGVTYWRACHCGKEHSVFVVDCWPCLLCPSQASWSEDLGTGKTAALPRLPPCDGDGVFPQGHPTMWGQGPG